jgi:hypothetical protein
MAFHLPLIAGATSVAAAGTFIVEKAQGKSNEEALKSSGKVVVIGLKVATLAFRSNQRHAANHAVRNMTIQAATDVNGYYRANGTYVLPHHRSFPDGNIFNNFSTKGNMNPYTGKLGTQNS